MSYSRFGTRSNWYLWWHDNKHLDGKSKNHQVLAIAHCNDTDSDGFPAWPRYFTYRQLKDDLEGCLLILRLYLPPRIKFTKLHKYIQLFIEDVERDFGGE